MSLSVEEYNVDADLMAHLLTGESKVEDEQSNGEETIESKINRFHAENAAFRDWMESREKSRKADLKQFNAELKRLHQAIAAQQVMLDELNTRMQEDEARWTRIESISLLVEMVEYNEFC